MDGPSRILRERGQAVRVKTRWESMSLVSEADAFGGGGRVRPLIVNKAIGRLHFLQDFRPSDGLFHVVFNAMSNACIVTCYVPN